MAKTRAQRKAERRAREAQEQKRSGDGEARAQSRAQHDTQVPVSGDVAEIEAVEAGIAAGAPESRPRDARRAEDRPAPSAAPRPSGAKEAEKRQRERAEAPGSASSSRSKQKQASAERQRGGVIGFLASCWAELKKVQWPDRDTLVQATAVTIIFVAVAAAYLGALDAVFNFLDQADPLAGSPNRRLQMYRWYVINTYSGHENKVKHNLEHRVQTMSQNRNVRQVVVPTEQVMEVNKDGQKEPKEKRTMPGYVLVNMEMTDDAWGLVKNTPGVTGFVGSRNKPVPLSKPEVDRLLHRETAERPRTQAQFSIGESVKVISGPLSDFSGEIAEINEDAAKLKVLVSIFGRETPVEVDYDQVKKI